MTLAPVRGECRFLGSSSQNMPFSYYFPLKKKSTDIKKIIWNPKSEFWNLKCPSLNSKSLVSNLISQIISKWFKLWAWLANGNNNNNNINTIIPHTPLHTCTYSHTSTCTSFPFNLFLADVLYNFLFNQNKYIIKSFKHALEMVGGWEDEGGEGVAYWSSVS